jgi:general L-amino acid transport system permease protein
MMTSHAPTQSYAIGQHPQLLPPPSERGIIKWARERLFNTWYNALGTAAMIYVVYLTVPGLLNWVFFDAVWLAKNNKECWAQGDGACWGFIRARITFFMYGFYDADSHWRPNTALFTLVCAGAIVIIPQTPDQLKRYAAMFITFVFPWIAAGLLVGPVSFSVLQSTIGQVLCGALFVGAVALAWHAHRHNDATRRIIGLSVVYAITVLLVLSWGLGLPELESRSFGGLLLTLVLAITSIFVSLPLGILFALGRRADGLPLLRYFCIGVIELFRAVPLITVLFMAQFMIPLFLPQGFSFDDVIMALVGLVIFYGSYMAEVVRGGLQAMPRGQYEAASSIGFNYYLSMRLIILPQALKIVIPGIVSQFIGIFKSTSLVTIIGLFDILNVAKSSIADTKWLGMEWEGYAFVAMIYWIFCFSMSRYSQWLERRLDTGHRSEQ